MEKTGIVRLEGKRTVMPQAVKELEALLSQVRLCGVKIQVEWQEGVLIAIEEQDIVEALEEIYERKPTAEEIQAFKNYLDIDVPQWLADNRKAYAQKLLEEGRTE